MQSPEQTLQRKLVSQQINTDIKLWIRSGMFGFFLSFLIGLYYVAVGRSFHIETLNAVIADTGLILIGISFMFSALCYFWNFADRYIMYRKHLGLVGFLFASTHVVLSFLIYPAFVRFERYDIHDAFYLKFFYGLFAFAIFTLMAVISNRYAVQELGGALWRRLLRLGYIGYVFTILHFAPALYPEWLKWFNHLFFAPRLPPFSLISFLFGSTVLILRTFLFLNCTPLFRRQQSCECKTNIDDLSKPASIKEVS